MNALPNNPLLLTTLLLVGSNVFTKNFCPAGARPKVSRGTRMTFAWYGHLKNLGQSPWYIAALISWGIALFEYMLQVPDNRIGYGTLNLAQLKILQEVITLSVFVPFSMWYMQQPLKMDYLYAAACLMGAVYFIFRA